MSQETLVILIIHSYDHVFWSFDLKQWTFQNYRYQFIQDSMTESKGFKNEWKVDLFVRYHLVQES